MVLTPIKPDNFTDEMKEAIRKNSAKYIDLAPREFVIKRYLTALYENADKSSDAFAILTVKDYDAEWVREFCKRNELTKNDRITLKGIEFLNFLENKSINKKQMIFNIIVTIATVIMAITTIMGIINH